MTATSPSNASNSTYVSTVKTGVEVELLTRSSCLTIDTEIDSISNRSYKPIAFLESKLGAGLDRSLVFGYVPHEALQADHLMV
ncbi:hypothetical protein TNIN_235501 [Trichonephila inaurata madagascariensis]|uniref:Uncharacterized protein n=1 Tax=Trichonephila inaurata madagascariensis TaxID=2747483 RepID=A0A8X7CAA9_9ARAC|nr:hypothetical protein TNIN_235501 [Trichonephila inaurata madagascariensis]